MPLPSFDPALHSDMTRLAKRRGYGSVEKYNAALRPVAGGGMRTMMGQPPLEDAYRGPNGVIGTGMQVPKPPLPGPPAPTMMPPAGLRKPQRLIDNGPASALSPYNAMPIRVFEPQHEYVTNRPNSPEFQRDSKTYDELAARRQALLARNDSQLNGTGALTPQTTDWMKGQGKMMANSQMTPSQQAYVAANGPQTPLTNTRFVGGMNPTPQSAAPAADENGRMYVARPGSDGSIGQSRFAEGQRTGMGTTIVRDPVTGKLTFVGAQHRRMFKPGDDGRQRLVSIEGEYGQPASQANTMAAIRGMGTPPEGQRWNDPEMLAKREQAKLRSQAAQQQFADKRYNNNMQRINPKSPDLADVQGRIAAYDPNKVYETQMKASTSDPFNAPAGQVNGGKVTAPLSPLPDSELVKLKRHPNYNIFKSRYGREPANMNELNEQWLGVTPSTSMPGM